MSFFNRSAVVALLLGVLIGGAFNVPHAISEPTISGGTFIGGSVINPVNLPNGTAAAPALGFSTNNGTTDQVGIWKDAASRMQIGNGPTGTNAVINFKINNSDLFQVGGSLATWSVMSAAPNGLLNLGVAFASLATPSNGTMIFCSDCKITTGTPGNPSTYTDNTCANGGNGAWAFRLNGVWRCYQ